MNRSKTNPELALFSIALLIVIFAFALSSSDEADVTGDIVKITGMQITQEQEQEALYSSDEPISYEEYAEIWYSINPSIQEPLVHSLYTLYVGHFNVNRIIYRLEREGGVDAAVSEDLSTFRIIYPDEVTYYLNAVQLQSRLDTGESVTDILNDQSFSTVQIPDDSHLYRSPDGPEFYFINDQVYDEEGRPLTNFEFNPDTGELTMIYPSTEPVTTDELILMFSTTTIESTAADTGLEYQEVSLWLRNGFTADDAIYWNSYDFNYAEAKEWMIAGFDDPLTTIPWRSDFDPLEARDWRATGLTATQSRDWRAARFTSEQAGGWFINGYTLQQAEDWRAININTFEEVEDWLDYGFSYDEVKRWSWDSGFEFQDAAEWDAAGFSPEQARSLRSLRIPLTEAKERFPLAMTPSQIDESIQEMERWNARGFPPEEYDKWNELGVELQDAVEWDAAGFPLELVEALLEQDIPSAEDALRIYGSAPEAAFQLIWGPFPLTDAEVLDEYDANSEAIKALDEGDSVESDSLVWRRGANNELYYNSIEEDTAIWRNFRDDNYYIEEDGSFIQVQAALLPNFQIVFRSIKDGRTFDLNGNLLTTPSEEPSQYEQDLQRAADLIQDNKPEEARNILERLLREHPEHPRRVEALTSLGETHLIAGEFDKARSAFEEARGHEPRGLANEYLKAMDFFGDKIYDILEYVYDPLYLGTFGTEDPDHLYRYDPENDRVVKLDKKGDIVAYYLRRDDGTWYWDKDGVNKGDMSDAFNRMANIARGEAPPTEEPPTEEPPPEEPEPTAPEEPDIPDELREMLPEDLTWTGEEWIGVDDEGNEINFRQTPDGWSYFETEKKDGEIIRTIHQKFDSNEDERSQETVRYVYDTDRNIVEQASVLTRRDEDGNVETRTESIASFSYEGEIMLYTIFEVIYDGGGVAIGYRRYERGLENGEIIETEIAVGEDEDGNELPDEDTEGILEALNKKLDFSLENIWYGLETAARGGVGRFFNLFMKDEELREWQEKVDKFFCTVTLGLADKDCFASKFCERHIPKTSQGFAYMDIPGVTTREAVFVLGERSKFVYDPNQTTTTTEYLYKLNYKVENPTDGDIYFNVYLYGDQTISIYDGDIKLEKGKTKSWVGMSANIKYSSYFYNKICVKFDRKIRFAGKTETDEVCNEITKTTTERATRYTPPLEEGEEEEIEVGENDW